MIATTGREKLIQYGFALSVPFLLTAVLLGLGRPLSNANAALFYQLGVLGGAIASGLIPSMLTALLSMLAFHFFFVPAYFSFKLESSDDLVRLAVFLAVAISTSGLASRARAEARVARQRAAETTSLYELSQVISAQVDLTTILPTIAATTCRLLDVPHCAILLLNPDGTLREQGSAGTPSPEEARIEADLHDGAVRLGILRVTGMSAAESLSPHNRQLLDTLAAQASLAITRANLVQQVAHTEALAQSDQLKTALIASVSHDLRTPLAAIKVAASSLQSADIVLDSATQLSLAHSIEREADQLDRTVRNLLEMSNIEAGTLELNRGWYDLPELIGVVLQRLETQLAERQVTVTVEPDLPFVWANAVLLEQVLINLLENAVKYTPHGSPLSVDAAYSSTTPSLAVTIRDYGSGIPEEELDAIFTTFYRGKSIGQHIRGSGLGLSICRGIVTAHGGTIEARNCQDGGAAFTLTLPVAASEVAEANPTKAFIHREDNGENSRAYR